MEKTITNSILLIDDSINLGSMKNFFNTDLIISFDISSHKQLEKQKIKHITSDSFLSEKDYDEIQEKSYDIERWFNLEELKEFLIFEKINLGELTYFYTSYFFTRSLKKFLEISKIHEKYPESHFIATPHLCKMLEYFTTFFKRIEENVSSNSYSNKIQYDFKIGKLNIPIKISPQRYKTLKKLFETFFSLFFNPKHISNNKKSVLLIEFDPIKYENLLLHSKSSSVNFILYNRRRPAIWNLKSFNILRKSNTKFISENNFVDNKLIDDCDVQTKIYEQKISNILDLKYSPKTFQFKDKDLWPLFKTQLIHLVVERIKSNIFEILLAKNFLDTCNVDSLIITSETAPVENILMILAQMKKIPVILMQHGVYYDLESISILRNSIAGTYPNKSDYVVVWGDITKKHLISMGYDQTKIKDLGCSMYDNIDTEILNNKKTILVTTSPPMGDFAIDLSVNTNLNYEKAIKQICLFCKNNALDLLFKLHPSLEENISELIKTNFKNAEIISYGNVIPLIKKCSLVITFDLSTTILESQLLSKPTISISIRDTNTLNSKIFEDSCPRIPIENLEVMITKILHDDTFRNDLIKKGNIFSKLYLSQRNNSCLSTLNFLEDL